MQPFEYIRADEADAAIALVGRDPDAQYLAGGTTQLDLMLKDGVLEPRQLVDITRLPLRAITRADGALHVGALTTMEELAANPTVAERLLVTASLEYIIAQAKLLNSFEQNLLAGARVAAAHLAGPVLPERDCGDGRPFEDLFCRWLASGLCGCARRRNGQHAALGVACAGERDLVLDERTHSGRGRRGCMATQRVGSGNPWWSWG